MKTAAILLCLLTTACGKPAPAAVAKADPPTVAQAKAGGETGRYQIVFSPHVRADTFLLDTATGQVWQMTQFSDLRGSPTAWDPMTRLDTFQDEKDFALAFGKAPKPH